MRRALCVALMVVAGALPADEWPTWCHDLGRSGQASGQGPSQGTIAWAAELGGSVDASPVIVGDHVYVGNSDGKLVCLRRDSGALVWEFRTEGPVLGAAEVGAGRVYTGSVDGSVYALDASSGVLVWRHRTERPVLTAPAFLGDRVVFGSTDGTIRAVDPATGRTLWLVAHGAPVSAPPAVADGVLCFGDERGGVFALQSSDGTEVWRGKLSGQVIGAPTVAGDVLLVPLMSASALGPPETEFLTAWRLSDGTKLWSAEKPSAESVMGSPVVVGKTVWALLVGGYVSTGVLNGYSLADGKKVGEQKFGVLVADAALAVAGDTLYLAGENGLVYFLSAKSGAVVKSVALGGKVFSSPAIADGRLYVGCQDGKLYCIE